MSTCPTYPTPGSLYTSCHERDHGGSGLGLSQCKSGGDLACGAVTGPPCESAMSPGGRQGEDGASWWVTQNRPTCIAPQSSPGNRQFHRPPASGDGVPCLSLGLLQVWSAHGISCSVPMSWHQETRALRAQSSTWGSPVPFFMNVAPAFLCINNQGQPV